MEHLRTRRKKTPKHIRKPIILVVGSFFLLLSGAIGWLPGPGGIPVFLLGIAILASEFAWAERVRDGILGYIHRFGAFMRRKPLAGWTIIALCALCSLSLIYLAFFRH
jgi:hypothetical protein